MKVENGGLFPVFQPEVSRDFAVVFIGLSVAQLLRMLLARPRVDPTEETEGRDFRPVGPVVDTVDNLIARVVRNPATVYSSPNTFFARTLASMSSATTSFLTISLACNCLICRSFW
ncbi:MAG: hypothetical protein JWM11_7940 [Planctomycetaceae bacterium]|nr:hypothetical protein [Planctomycetaceae bacterium]